MADLSVYDNDPTLYLFTSLTAGSSHIVTATSRIETILKANKIPFKGVDTATDDLARKLYGRRASGKKLPLLVKEGYVIADLEQVEEWNEYDELKEVLGAPSAPAPAAAKPASAAAPAAPVEAKESEPSATSEQNLAIRQLGAEAAKVAAAKKSVPEKISTTNPLLSEKINSPATSTPTKETAKGDTGGILSPRSIPLPATPNPATAAAGESSDPVPDPAIPKITSKPVHSPPSMHIDASNPDLAKPPISTTAKSPTSSIASPPPLSRPGSGLTSPVTEFHGSKIGMASEEEIKKIEQELAIAEVSSSEEEDSQDERKGKEKKSDEKAEKEVKAKKEDVSEDKEDKPQEQSATAAEKAGESVKD